MLGFLVAVWAAPTMTSGTLLFSIGTTAYIPIALQLTANATTVAEFPC